MNTSRMFETDFAEFAKDYIAGHDEFHQMTTFPDIIWKKMREQRLFGIGIDLKYDGHGGSSRTIATSGKALVEHGGNLGIAMTWMMHELIAKGLIAKFGNRKQKNEYLPKLAHGEVTASLAASEPNTGAHPKYIKTIAEPVNGGFCITGEKTYLTNGPIADIFIVIAVTGHESDKKAFTAFLVRRDTLGLTVSDPLTLPILRPSPHGGIILNNCFVGCESILGNLGDAYETILKPFRELEDTMMMGPISGGLQYQLNELKRLVSKENMTVDDALILELGLLQCTVDALSVLAQAAADKIDVRSKPQSVTSLTLFFRKQAADCQERLNLIFAKIPGQPDSHLSAMATDVAGGIRIASSVAKLKLHKIGEMFMIPDRST
jgi:hypothetical protein